MRACSGLVLVFLCASHVFAAEVFFTPGQDCEDRIVAAIGGAKKEVAAAVYSINNARIVDALHDAHERGVKLRVLTDALQAAGKSSAALSLARTGVPLRVHSKHKIMHNKFAVVDGKWAVTGSYNWTQPASKDNSENCVVFTEADVIRSFRDRFEVLWKLNTEVKSRTKLARIAAKRGERLPAAVR